MVVCVNCNHDNPEGASLCETCYTPLPKSLKCPNCKTSVLASAIFCGQCGFSLLEKNNPLENKEQNAMNESKNQFLEDKTESSFFVSELKILGNTMSKSEENTNEELDFSVAETNVLPSSLSSLELSESPITTIQNQRASLLHIQTNKEIELPVNLQVIHLGKDNTRVPPDIDVSGLPDSQFVSRIHADIRVEADAFYLEDTGSANGTYVNHIPLPKGNRHRLRSGDRIALGKEDKVSFIFQLPS